MAEPGPKKPDPKKQSKPVRKPAKSAGVKRTPDDDDDDDSREPKIPLKWKALSGGGLALVEPFCAREREDDLDEVHSMMRAEEYDIARDELLYLVSDCRAFFTAHNLLGEIALIDGDVGVARGHFGFVLETVMKGLPSGFAGRLPARRGYNTTVFSAGKSLARCLVALEEIKGAGTVLKRLAAWDPTEREVQSLLEEWHELNRQTPDGKPLVTLQLMPPKPRPE
jgi:hypothetical protein